MSGWLIDTRLFKVLDWRGGARPGGLRGWFKCREEPLFLSAISIVEIKAAIENGRRLPNKRADLSDWLGHIVANFGDRIYPIDAEVALRAGVLVNRSSVRGAAGLPYAILAATAQIYGHGILTHWPGEYNAWNEIELCNPFE